MFELTLCLNYERQKYLSEFYKQIASSIKKNAGVITKHNSGGKSYLVIAAAESQKEFLKAKILEFILQVIKKEYKYFYLKENIEVKSKDEITEAFFSAITNFDEEIDRGIIQENIDLSGEIVLESFYYFKLQPLRDRWQKTAKIINNNLIMANFQAILEVLYYLCDTSENYASCLNITFFDEKIELVNSNKSKYFKKDFEGKSNFYAEIIKLNPLKINVLDGEKESSFFEEATSTLVRVFHDKIYFI